MLCSQCIRLFFLRLPYILLIDADSAVFSNPRHICLPVHIVQAKHFDDLTFHILWTDQRLIKIASSIVWIYFHVPPLLWPHFISNSIFALAYASRALGTMTLTLKFLDYTDISNLCSFKFYLAAAYSCWNCKQLSSNYCDKKFCVCSWRSYPSQFTGIWTPWRNFSSVF